MDGYADLRFTHDGLTRRSQHEPPGSSDPPEGLPILCGSLKGVDRDTQRDLAGRVVKNGYAPRKMIGDT